MASGTYGTTGFADIDIVNDVDIWYFYRPSRTENDPSYNGFKKITNPTDVLTKATFDDPTTQAKGVKNILGGMYNVKLPLTIFNQKGIYTVYIKPKEVITTIADSDAVLAAYPDIRGVVLKTSALSSTNPTQILENGNLVGYKIYYFNNNGDREDLFRIVTSNNKAEVVNANLTDSNQKSVQYRYNDNSDLVFITVTPSSAVSFKPNATPFIGSVGQTISLVNTKFNPIALEIEMVDYDEQDLATLLVGNQTRSMDDNVVTTYNSSSEIFNQFQVYTLKTDIGEDKFQVREDMTDNVDFSKSWDNIVG